jgi:hypothetical protein
MFGLKNTTFVAILTPILLTATTVVPVLDYVLTAAMTTLIRYYFCYHLLSSSLITSSVALPKDSRNSSDVRIVEL